MLRPPRDQRDTKAIDESTDTYDTIEWLLKNVPRNNGRVGHARHLVSAAGSPSMAMLDPHPALKAVSPQASPADMFLGDDFHHNGAFRLSYGFEYATMMETNKEMSPFAFDSARHLRLVSQARLARQRQRAVPSRGRSPPGTTSSTHSELRRLLAAAGASTPYLDAGARCRRSTWPAGGTRRTSTARSRSTRRSRSTTRSDQNYLVVGPWNHGGWSGASGQTLGAIDFGSATRAVFPHRHPGALVRLLAQGQGKLALAEATTFEAGDQRSGDPTTPGRRRRTCSRGGCTSTPDGKLSFDRAHGRRRAPASTRTSPIPPTRCRTARARSRRTFGQRLDLVALAGRRPALRSGPARRADAGRPRRSTNDVVVAGDDRGAACSPPPPAPTPTGW